MRLLAKQRNRILRLNYLYEISTIPAEYFVFVDESGVDRRTVARRTGWASSGVRPARSSVLDRDLSYQMLPALFLDGAEVSIYEGSPNAEGFMFWLERMLLPRMCPYPGPQS